MMVIIIIIIIILCNILTFARNTNIELQRNSVLRQSVHSLSTLCIRQLAFYCWVIYSNQGLNMTLKHKKLQFCAVVCRYISLFPDFLLMIGPAK
jgi:hypothetical protein